MSTVVNMLEAKTSLSELVRQVESGACSEIIIARSGRAAARLVPSAVQPPERRLRIGVAKARFAVPDPDAATDTEIHRLFEDRDARVCACCSTPMSPNWR
jgi:antitoxin (DNA-binding transcriptional repressor) of toxin-antitoxin stability system